MITQGSLRQACWRAGISQPVMETTVGGVLCVDAEAAPGQCGLMFARSGDAVRRRVTFAELPTEADRAACGLPARFDPGGKLASRHGDSAAGFPRYWWNRERCERAREG